MAYDMYQRYVRQALYPEENRPKVVAPPPTHTPAEKAANFVLVKLAPGATEKTMKKLRSIKAINGIHAVFGEYDLVLIIREKKEVDRQALLKDIRAIQGVIEVQTLLSAS